jgi:hypothetical protein
MSVKSLDAERWLGNLKIRRHAFGQSPLPNYPHVPVYVSQQLCSVRVESVYKIVHKLPLSSFHRHPVLGFY